MQHFDKYCFRSLCYPRSWYTNFGLFLPNLEILTSQKKYKFQNIEKLIKKLDLIYQKCRSFYFCLVRYITLKLFWRTFQNDVIKEPLFQTFPQALHKTLTILAFWNKHQFSWWLIENLSWYRESCIPTKWEICRSSGSLLKMTWQIKYRTGETLDPDLTLTCGIF